MKKKTSRTFFCTSWIHFHEHSLKDFGRLRKLCSHSLRKKINIYRKMYRKFLCTRKLTNWDFFQRISLIVWKIAARSWWLKNVFFRKRYQVVPLHTYSATVRSVPNFVNSNCEKKVVMSPRELITFWRTKNS